MSILKKTLIFIVMIFPLFSCQAEVEANIYHIKFEWKKEKKISEFYKMTTYIYDSFRTKGIYLYAEYGNLDGIHIFISKKVLFDELKKTLANARNGSIDAIIDNDISPDNPLSKFFYAKNGKPDITTCEVKIPKEFHSSEESFQLASKMQYEAFRKGYFVGVTYEGTPTDYNLVFAFYGGCAAKEAITNDLLNVISK